MKRAVFLDRDGTLGGTGGGVHPDEFEFFPYVFTSIKKLNKNGFYVFLITNQSRIDRGYYTEEEFIIGFRKLQNQLKHYDAWFDDVFFCPHKEDSNCLCRKPKTGLFEYALNKYPDINILESYIIGDRGEQDMLFGESINLRKILVKTGMGELSLNENRHMWENCSPDFVAETLEEAVDFTIGGTSDSRKNMFN